VDRSGLAAGTFQTAVRFTSNGGEVRLSVIMQVVDGDIATGNAGNQFILLIDDRTGEVVEQAEPGVLVDAAAYSFGQVLPGTYVIVGGTDHDSDGFICDAAESCGAFPVLDPLTLQTVTIEGARDDLDYVATFNSDLASDGAAAPADAAGEMTVQQAVRSLLGRRGIPIRRGANVLATAARPEASP
jgi:serine protease